MFTLGLVLDGLVYSTKLHEPTISTTKSELYLCSTNAWYVQCDIIYFSLTHLQSILNKVILYYIFLKKK